MDCLWGRMCHELVHYDKYRASSLLFEFLMPGIHRSEHIEKPEVEPVNLIHYGKKQKVVPGSAQLYSFFYTGL